MKRTPKFSPAAAEKYNLKNVAPGLYDFPGFGEINLETITLEQADALAERKFPYLVAKRIKVVEAQSE